MKDITNNLEARLFVSKPNRELNFGPGVQNKELKIGFPSGSLWASNGLFGRKESQALLSQEHLSELSGRFDFNSTLPPDPLTGTILQPQSKSPSFCVPHDQSKQYGKGPSKVSKGGQAIGEESTLEVTMGDFRVEEELNSTPITILMKEGNILCWNCRGAKSREFLIGLKELRRNHKPMLIILLEQRISGMETDVICKKVGKPHWIRPDAEGFSGGIWLLWDEAEVQINLIHAHKFFVHAEVRNVGGINWLLTVIYASPKTTIQNHLWVSLEEMWIKGPWMLVGDFNCVLRSGERNSGT